MNNPFFLFVLILTPFVCTFSPTPTTGPEEPYHNPGAAHDQDCALVSGWETQHENLYKH